MTNKLFVGSLSWDTTDTSLRDFFAQAGTVLSAKVITDRTTGKSKGFGFVEMESEDQAKEAIEKLNGQSLDSRNITVREAKEQAPRTDFRRDGGGFGSRPSSGRSFGNRDRSRSRY